MKGKLITLEGTEGVGKSTQIQLLSRWLHSNPFGFQIKTLVTRQPGGTDLGVDIRKMLLGTTEPIAKTTELLLYAADRAQHVTEIKQYLEAGFWVICDRYTDSAVAYQGYGRKMDLKLISQVNSIATQGTIPDLTLWLNMNVEIALQRARAGGKGDRLEAEALEFHKRVYKGFAALERQEKRIVTIDASGTEKQTAWNIQHVIKEWFGS
jgi:dTMP kinase